jgi:hypothetical protein
MNNESQLIYNYFLLYIQKIIYLDGIFGWTTDGASSNLFNFCIFPKHKFEKCFFAKPNKNSTIFYPKKAKHKNHLNSKISIYFIISYSAIWDTWWIPKC